jgi:calcineurin-like phosphoesterase
MRLVRILILGDIVGKPGRRAAQALLPELRRKHRIDFTVANVENAAGGFGVTPDIAEELHAMGIDVMTGGNHIWDKREVYPFLDSCEYLLRPANYPDGAPGRGTLICDLGRARVGVINLSGRAFLDPLECPFQMGLRLAQSLA